MIQRGKEKRKKTDFPIFILARDEMPLDVRC